MNPTVNNILTKEYQKISDPYQRLGVAIVYRAVKDAMSKDAILSLEALDWLMTDRSEFTYEYLGFSDTFREVVADIVWRKAKDDVVKKIVFEKRWLLSRLEYYKLLYEGYDNGIDMSYLELPQLRLFVCYDKTTNLC